MATPTRMHGSSTLLRIVQLLICFLYNSVIVVPFSYPKCCFVLFHTSVYCNFCYIQIEVLTTTKNRYIEPVSAVLLRIDGNCISEL